jgi:xanthine dehydrogenase YagR molybdenum-binding subunit
MAEWMPLEKRKYVGKKIPRTDGPAKVCGTAKFSYDIVLPGMLYGRILRSPHPHAYIKSIDLSKARKHPGVKAVIDMNKYTVRYQGDEIAAVAATSMDVAKEALRLIEVEYQQLPYVSTEQEAMTENAPRVFEQGNVGWERAGNKDAVEKTLAESAHVVDDEMYSQVQVHNCMETHGCVAQWKSEDNLKVWISTQAVHGNRGDFASFFDIPEENVEIICEYMGGGFGSKFSIGVEGQVCARLARMAGKPVKLMLNRKEEYLAVGNRPSAKMHIKLGCDSSGKITGMWQESYGTGGIGAGAGVPLPYVYQIPKGAYYKKHGHVRINAGSARAQRAPGHPQAAFGMDIIVDQLAYKAGIDPIEFRIINDPNETRQRQYRIGAERIGWGEKFNKVPGAGAGNKKRGVGVGVGRWGGGGARSTKVTVEVFPDGLVTATTGSQDLGTGVRTMIHQITADALGIPMKLVTPRVGRSTYPFSTASGGSITTGSVTPAVVNTCDGVRRQLYEKVAAALGVSADDLVGENGVISARSDSGKSIKWKEACALLQGQPISVTDGWAEGLSSSGVAGVQLIEVEVDTETGRIKPIKVVAVQDFGLCINRLTSLSQINGAIIMGLSWALNEDRTMDPGTGTMVNPNMENYKLAGTMEMPEFDIVIDEQPERGVIGLGEPPRVPTAGALANAVYNAIGARVTRMPMTPDVVLEALKKGGA